MKIWTWIVATILTALSSVPAFAFTLNKFIRVPDWMDFYLLTFAVGVAVSMLMVFLTKPVDIPMSELYKHKHELNSATNFFRFSALLCLAAFFLMFFAGMALVRMS